MTFGKTVLGAIAALYFSLTGAGGLTANTATAAEPMQPSEIRKVLGSKTCQIQDLRGYKMCEGTDRKMKLIAGLEAGTMKPRVEVRKGKKQLFWMGSPDSVSTTALDDMLSKTDVNDDGIITGREAAKKAKEVYKNTPVGNTNLAHVIDTINVAGSISMPDLNGDGIPNPKKPSKRTAKRQSTKIEPASGTKYLSQSAFNRLIATNPEAKQIMDKVYGAIDSLNRQWHRDGVRMGLKTDVAFKDGKIDLKNSSAFMFYKKGADTDRIQKGLENLEVSCGQGKDGRVLYCNATNIPRIDRGKDWRHFTWGDFFMDLQDTTSHTMNNADKARVVARAPDNGGDDLKPENIRFTYIHTDKDGKTYESEFELSDTPGYAYYLCEGGKCEGTNGRWPGNLTKTHKVSRSKGDTRRYIVLNRQKDGGHIAEVPFWALLGVDSGASGLEKRVSGEDKDNEPIPSNGNMKLPEEDKGKKEGDKRKVVITKMGEGNKEVAGEHDNNTYMGIRGLVSASNLMPDNVAGGAEFYFGNRMSDTNWSLEFSFGYLSGGSDSNDRDLTTAPNPNDPRDRDIIFTGTESVSSDYRILVPRVGFAYDVADNLRLGFRVGADIVLKNTNTTIDERLEYLNGELAGTPNHESHSNTDVTAMPGASLTLDWQVYDNTSLSFEVNGATDGDNYAVGAGLGITFEWEW